MLVVICNRPGSAKKVDIVVREVLEIASGRRMHDDEEVVRVNGKMAALYEGFRPFAEFLYQEAA